MLYVVVAWSNAPVVSAVVGEHECDVNLLTRQLSLHTRMRLLERSLARAAARM